MIRLGWIFSVGYRNLGEANPDQGIVAGDGRADRRFGGRGDRPQRRRATSTPMARPWSVGCTAPC